MGANAVLLVWSAWLLLLPNITGAECPYCNDYLLATIPAFRVLLVPVVWAWLWAFCCKIWEDTSINYIVRKASPPFDSPPVWDPQLLLPAPPRHPLGFSPPPALRPSPPFFVHPLSLCLHAPSASCNAVRRLPSLTRRHLSTSSPTFPPPPEVNSSLHAAFPSPTSRSSPPVYYLAPLNPSQSSPLPLPR